MFFSSYHRLPHGDIYDDKTQQIRFKKRLFILNSWWKTICAILSILLAASTLANAFFFYNFHLRPHIYRDNAPSQYTGLQYNLLKTIEPEAKYFSLNRTVQDAAWNDQILNSSRLIVALEDDFAMSLGLPHAMRWPWNAKKGVYLLAAGHQIHCLQVLRQWINDKQDNKEEADMQWDYSHALHCLNTLRETVMCFADDIPLYTGRVHENVYYKKLLAGRGMTRMCRNWDTLKDWADKHSACYMPLNTHNKVIKELDSYKYCPDGSHPWREQTNV